MINHFTLTGTRLRVAQELALIIPAIAAYRVVRGVATGSSSAATQNADLVIDTERALGIFREPALQRLFLPHHDLIIVANWVYSLGFFPLIGVVAAWLFFRRPAVYALCRNAFLISGVAGLIVFLTFPVAPPRLMDLGMVDTVQTYSNVAGFVQMPGFLNEYAAMPSFHVGWVMLLGIVLVKESNVRVVQLAGWVMPVAMMTSTVVTANHFFLDGAAGAALSLTGLWAAERLADRRTRRRRAVGGSSRGARRAGDAGALMGAAPRHHHKPNEH